MSDYYEMEISKLEDWNEELEAENKSLSLDVMGLTELSEKLEAKNKLFLEVLEKSRTHIYNSCIEYDICPTNFVLALYELEQALEATK